LVAENGSAAAPVKSMKKQKNSEVQ